VTAHSPLDSRLELWLAKRAAGILSYTQGGANHLAAHGIPRPKITVLNNSTDTVTLRQIRSALAPDEIARFRSAHSLGHGPVVAYVGSLDESKQLHLLFAAGDILAESLAGFQLIIAGDGPQRDYVARESANRPYVRPIGRAGQRELAIISVVAGLLINPGRVGLVAVDAAALGMPILTTDFGFHAPELEYLTGECLQTVPQDGKSLAKAALGWLTYPDALEGARAAASSIGDTLSIEHMAEQFVLAVISAAERRPGTN
jgi:glycosyltransferase involved in cell wall biosynthesis